VGESELAMEKLKSLPDKFAPIREFVDGVLGQYSAEPEFEIEEELACDDVYVTVSFWGDTWVNFRCLEGGGWEMLDGNSDNGNWEPEFYESKFGNGTLEEQWEAMFWRNAYFNKGSKFN